MSNHYVEMMGTVVTLNTMKTLPVGDRFLPPQQTASRSDRAVKGLNRVTTHVQYRRYLPARRTCAASSSSSTHYSASFHFIHSKIG